MLWQYNLQYVMTIKLIERESIYQFCELQGQNIKTKKDKPN